MNQMNMNGTTNIGPMNLMSSMNYNNKKKMQELIKQF